MDDAALLHRFTSTGCQASFRGIVNRHGGWVFSVALRAVRDRHLAEDVAQAVFLILSRKAKTINPDVPLSGWLFKTTRFAISDALKRRTRMKNRENRFAEFFKATNAEGAAPEADTDVPDELSHELDEAVALLSEQDRQAILLRFYENKNLAQIGEAMGTSEEAAKKRVARAIEKLRKQFARKGLVATAAFILMMLGRQSAQAAALKPAAIFPAAGAPTLAHSIAQGAIQMMAQAHARLLGAILAAAFAILIGVPSLGSAVIRLATTQPAAEMPVEEPVVLASVNGVQATSRTLDLPAESKFADLYIGYKGQILWRSDAYTSKNPYPFYLKSGETQEKPYAVAVDHNGRFFMKLLDQELLNAPVIRESRYDYDSGPTEPGQRVNNMMSLIESNQSGFAILPAVHPRPSREDAKKDWTQLNRSDEDGTVVIEQDKAIPGMEMQTFWGVEVPEPGTLGLVSLAACAWLMKRRGRRQG